MPLVILEGADGSGKSTLATRLLKGTGHPTILIKRSGPPGNVETLVFQSEWIAQQSRLGLNVIADRHPIISEAIYAPVVRKVPGPHWGPEDAYKALKHQRVMLVYCRTDDVTQRGSSHVEDQMEGVHEYYQDLVKEYDRWMDYIQDKGVLFYQYNYWNDPKAENVTGVIRNFWEGKWTV